MKLALVFLLIASTASAQSLTLPRVVLVGGQSFDTAATLLKFSQGCGERNTLAYGSQPSATRLVVTKASVVAIHWVAMNVLHKKGWETSAKVVGYLGGGFGAAAGFWNLTVRCR
jgi:hypothetical protein